MPKKCAHSKFGKGGNCGKKSLQGNLCVLLVLDLVVCGWFPQKKGCHEKKQIYHLPFLKVAATNGDNFSHW